MDTSWKESVTFFDTNISMREGGDYWKSKFTDIVRVSQLVLFCRAKVSVALPYYIIIYVYDHGTIGGVLSHIDVLVES